jgi:hypothetical protein
VTPALKYNLKLFFWLTQTLFWSDLRLYKLPHFKPTIEQPLTKRRLNANWSANVSLAFQ